jgi:hypothetical protein
MHQKVLGSLHILTGGSNKQCANLSQSNPKYFACQYVPLCSDPSILMYRFVPNSVLIECMLILGYSCMSDPYLV